MRIELLYFDGCPGHAELRERLPRLLQMTDVDAEIKECRIDSERTAHREHFLGSPTTRIDGNDVEPGAGARHDYGLKCRLYETEDDLRRTPPAVWITEALQATRASEHPRLMET